jgi:hypothetical protein
MMPKEQGADDQEQFEQIAERPDQRETSNGGLSNKVIPKTRGINTAPSIEQFPTSNKRAANSGGDCLNRSENHAVQPLSGCGRGKWGGGFSGGRGSGNLAADSCGTEGGVCSPGFQAQARSKAQKQKWEMKQDGQTDLGRKMYSISWLLQRRSKKTVQDNIYELPDFLNKHSLPLASQKRRYPFASSPSHPLTEQRVAGQK